MQPRMNFATTLAGGSFHGTNAEGPLNGEAACPALLGEANSASRRSSELQGQQELPVSTEEETVPIGEAVPEGEHLRTLRVYSKSSSPAPQAAASTSAPSESASTAAAFPAIEGGEESAGSCRSCRDVQVLRVFRDPDVMIAPNLITEEQCLHLLKLADGKWTRSKTSIGTTSAPQTAYKTTESRTRTSYSVMLEEAQTPGVMSVELLACALAQLPLQHLESLVLVRYAEGEYFSEHHDGGFRPKTVLLYLNDVEDGGYTHFTRLGLKIGPSQGSGALWSNVTPGGKMDFRTLHAGVAPTKGTKYVVNCFFNEAVVRPTRPPVPLSLELPQGIQVPELKPAGEVSPPPGQAKKDTAELELVSAHGQSHQQVEPAQLHQPQQRLQQQREVGKIGESQRLIWGFSGIGALGKKQMGCPAVFPSFPQQLWRQHEMAQLTMYPAMRGSGGGATLPMLPFGFPSIATVCPPGGCITHTTGGLHRDQRWV